MRNDPTKGDSFKKSDLWGGQKYENNIMVAHAPDALGRLPDGKAFKTNSLSGNERNRLFLRHGENFSDVSLVSGVDDLADGRSYVLLDYDQDGWQDIALMSLSNPRFKLYHNELARVFPDNKAFRLRLIGAQADSNSSAEFSNRDAIGARVLVKFASGNHVMIQKQAGEGFSGQNSETLSIGVPRGDAVVRLEIRWPSGKTRVVESPENAEIVTIRENDPEATAK